MKFLSRKDLEELLASMEWMDYAEWTKHAYRITIKKFYQWLAGYPLLIFGFLGWLYSNQIKYSVIKSKGRVVQFFKRFKK